MWFTERKNAKRSLFASCKNGIDYYSLNKEGINGDYDDKRSDFEIIRLSTTGG